VSERASELLRGLDYRMTPGHWSAVPHPHHRLIADLRNALPEIIAVVEAAELLPELFDADGRKHSFVPLLDVLVSKLSGGSG
jgi:hypothetical protein